MSKPPVVETVADFLEWAKQLPGVNMLFRGMSKQSHAASAQHGDASKRFASSYLYRHLSDAPDAPGGKIDILEKSFQTGYELILNEARMQGHRWRDGKKLEDLELMANLQHQGTPTCLIDFSRSSLIALWFACQPSKDGKAAQNGIVVAVDAGDGDLVQADHMEKKMDFFFSGDEPRPKFWVWNPAQNQNVRINSQQSAFVLGRMAIEIAPECVCHIHAESKKEILEELRVCGITDKSLFCDFDGFARTIGSVLSVKKSADDYYRTARRMHASGTKDDLHLAVQYYDKALEMDASVKDGYFYRGSAKFSLGNLSGALTDADKAVEIDSDNIINFWLRGIVKSASSDWLGAIADYGRAIEINPQLVEVHYSLALAKRQLGDYKGAIADYDKVIEITPQYVNAYFGRGIDKGHLGDMPGAIADYDRAIEINPQYADVYNNRGNAKHNLGDHKGAIADYDRAIEINPQDASAYYNRGNAKHNLGDYKGAIADHDRAIEINPQLALAYNNRGNAKHNLGGYKGAIADYDRVIEINPQDVIAHNNRGNAKNALGNHEDAIADYNRAIEINPQYAVAYYNRGIAKKKSGDTEGAEADFQKAKEIDPSLKPPKTE